MTAHGTVGHVMKTYNPFTTTLLLSFLAGVAFAQPSAVKKTTVQFESLERRIDCEFFDPDYLPGDSNYHSLISASDGKIYFTLGTHHKDWSAHFFQFDPATEDISLVGELDKVLGEETGKDISQGKIHTRLFEHDGKLWFASHTSFYEEGTQSCNRDTMAWISPLKLVNEKFPLSFALSPIQILNREF